MLDFPIKRTILEKYPYGETAVQHFYSFYLGTDFSRCSKFEDGFLLTAKYTFFMDSHFFSLLLSVEL